MILADTLIVGPRPFGIGVYTLNVVKELLRIRDDVVVLTHTPELFPGARKVKAPPHLSPERGKRAALYRLVYLQTLRGKGVLYRTYHSISLFWRGPQVITVHDVQPVIFPERYREQTWLYRYFLKPFIHRVDLVITVSQRAKVDILEFFRLDPDRVEVVYPSYEREVFKPGNSGFDVPPYLLMVGAVYPHKNAEVVVKALPYIPEYSLIIVGVGERYGERIRELAERLGVSQRVALLPYREKGELAELYRRAFALVFPSKYEGFGLPVLEAMASGCPVIGTDAVAEAGGKAILYASQEDPLSWVRAVRRLEEEREEYVRRGLERVKGFSWEKTARRISEILGRFQ